MKSKKSLFRSIFSLILSLAILSGMTVAVYAEAEPQTVDSGTCGENVSWTLYDNGKLVISGTGKMYDYSNSSNSFSPFFYKKSLLKEAVIEEGVTSIGGYAFYECSNLTSISIPDSVTIIGDYACYYCSYLTSIDIPNAVTSIGNSVFIWCNGLGKIKVDENNTVYDSRENCNAIIKTETNELIFGCKNTKIPDSVTSIGISAFSGCSGLTSISIPNSVTSIGSSAFYDCRGLTSISIPDGVTSIGKSTFYGCSGLTSIKISESATNIGENAFSYCSGLTSIKIPDNVTSIGNFAFGYCSGLKSINIPDSVTSIGDSVFRSCSDLTSISISKKITSVGNYFFYGCSSLTSIIIPDSVKSLGKYSFFHCSSLTSINIMNGVESIGDSAFSGCSGLTNIKIPDSVTSIGYSAFYGCSGLTSINISNSVTSIGDSAFKSCSGLTSVIIPDSVKSIGDYAFYGCNSLTSIKISNGVANIGKYLFYNCSSLTSIIIPDSVKSIDDYAFYGCSGLTSISIPNGVESIGNYTFYICSGLTNINIPNSMTKIGSYAFGYCIGLTSIRIPEKVTSINVPAFSYCKGLESIIVDENNTVYDSRENSNAIIKTDGNELISGCKATVIPDSVVSIGDYAFYECSGLTSISIPNSVISIGNSAFRNCSDLTSISMPDGVTSIGASAFSGCSGLTSINIPDSVTSIGDSAFSSCSGLTSVSIPDSVTNIGPNAFSYCGNLTSVVMSKNVTSIQHHTFYCCENLTNIEFSESIKSIDSYAFGYCSNLLITQFPESLETISSIAFTDCTKLKKYTGTISCGIKAVCGGITNALSKTCKLAVNGTELEKITKLTIPFDINTIVYNAFAKCTSLKEVTIGNNIKSIGSNAFANCPLETVYFKGTKAEWDEVCGKNVNLSSADVIFVDYSCGEELSAKFSLNSSTLTVFGSGRMDDYSSAEDLPWYGIKDSIKTVVFDGEPTSIGNYSFSGLTALENIEIPETVTSIGASAFKDCTALKTVNLPDGITGIGENAFYNTAVYNDPASYKGNKVLYLGDNRYLIAYGSQLDGQSFNGIVNPNAVLIADGAFRGADCETVQLNEGLKYIGKEAFADSLLKTLYFPEGVETCSKDIFKGCGSLTVNYGSSISDWYRKQISLPENSVVYFTAKTEDGNVSVIYCSDDLPQEIGDISIEKNSPELEVEAKVFDGSETQKKFGIISEHTISLDRYDDLEVMDIKLKNYKGEIQPKAGKSVRVKIKAPDSVREKILEFLDFRGDFDELKINSNGVFLNGNKNKFTTEQQKAVMQKIILWHAFNEGNYQGRIYESFTFDNNLRLENGYLIFYVEHFSEFSVLNSPFEFAEKEITLDIGTKKKLDFILLDDKKTIRFESSKTSVATVDGDGVVTAKGSGETVITAYSDGVEVGSCTVKVNSPTLIFSENLSGTKVDYLTTVNFSCQVENLPEGATVRWYIDGSEYALGETCTVKGVKKNFKISVKIVAEDGTVLTEKNEQLIEVKNGFFDKLLGFFRKLFGTLKTVNIS